MPYFVYKITEFPIRQLEKLDQYEAYRDASQQAKKLRGELADGAPCIIKVIFAETELHAEDLLNQVRVAAPEPGDD